MSYEQGLLLKYMAVSIERAQEIRSAALPLSKLSLKEQEAIQKELQKAQKNLGVGIIDMMKGVLKDWENMTHYEEV